MKYSRTTPTTLSIGATPSLFGQSLDQIIAMTKQQLAVTRSVEQMTIKIYSFKVAGTADERAALKVFVLAGAFADEEDLGVGIPLTKDGVRPRLAQPAFRAPADFVLVQHGGSQGHGRRLHEGLERLGFELFGERGAAWFDNARPSEFRFVEAGPASATSGSECASRSSENDEKYG